MHKLFLIILSPLFLILSSCDSNDTGDVRVENNDDILTQPSISSYQWHFKTNGKIRSTAVTDKEKVYFGNHAGELYALDKNTGNVIWQNNFTSSIEGTLLLVDNILIFPTVSQGIIAVDRSNGSKLWQFSLGKQSKLDQWDYFLSSATYSEGEIFIGASDGVIRNLDLATGVENWSIDLTYRIHSKPLIYQNKMYLSTVNALLCIDLETKQRVWSQSLNMPTSPVVSNNVISVGSRDYFTYGFVPESGELLWETPDVAWVTSDAIVDDGIVYQGTSDSYFLAAIDIKDGRTLWRASSGQNVFAAPSIEDGIVYLASGNAYANPGRGHIIATDKTGNTLWDLAGKNFFSSPVIDNKNIYIGGDDTNFYRIDTTILNNLNSG